MDIVSAITAAVHLDIYVLELTMDTLHPPRHIQTQTIDSSNLLMTRRKAIRGFTMRRDREPRYVYPFCIL